MQKNRFLTVLARILSLVLCTVIVTVSLTSCKDKDPDNSGEGQKVYNEEEDPIVFSTLELDEVFNPFFSTSATDSNVVGMTQISMLSNTATGEVAYGEDEGVVTLDYAEVSNGGVQDVDLKTTYYFVLKNDVKFSDGTPLTMKDVLFNLYVYLDPLYTGSATMYSTDIVGLKEYRTQESDENEGEQDSFRERFEQIAENRIADLVYAADEIIENNTGINAERFLQELTSYADEMGNTDMVNDYKKATELFREELETDYSNSMNSYEDMKFKDKDGILYENLFTTDVEVFLYNEGYITWNKKEAELENTITALGQGNELKSWTKERAIDYVYKDKIPGSISQIVQFWATSTNLFNYITNDAIEKEFGGDGEDRVYRNISGIKFANREEAVTVNGKTYAAIGKTDANYNDDGSVKKGFNEVLSITINNVDPKAKWNFAFAVAPLHYYSDKAHIEAFDYESNFGVQWGSQTFMDEVLNSPDKVGLPMGAGPYAASKSSGGINTKDNMNAVKDSQFFDANTVYYERNPHYVLGPAKIKKLRFIVVSSNGMLNALYNKEIDFAEPSAKPELIEEIKQKGYDSKSIQTSGYGYIGVNAGKVPSINVRQAIMHSINTQLCVDYYVNTAKAIYRPMSRQSWAYPESATAYYPFIGGEIPADLSKVSPAYKNFVELKGKKAGQKFTAEEQQEFIRGLVTEDPDFVEPTHFTPYSYTEDENGIYTAKVGSDATKKLKYTFTVAGEETDHPAWSAMILASEILNKCGFEVNVKTDSNALTKLATGSLTVWAAAWGSTIDPDMYQVYHKDSTATSTWNWGYREIKQNNGNRYDYESAIIDELSILIDKGRSFNDWKKRQPIYSQALDLVMELAVELPTYQRDDLFAYNQNKIDTSTFNQNPTAYKGLTSEIHTILLK